MKITITALLFAAAALAGTAAAHAQGVDAVSPGTLRLLDATPAPPQIRAAGQTPEVGGLGIKKVHALPVFPYTFVSPRDGKTYSGTVVGADPRNRDADTTTIAVVLIPLVVNFTGSSTASFDPTAEDAGCLGHNTAFVLTQQSPVFTQVKNFVINGVDVGTATLPDAVQRAEFWTNSNGTPLISAQPAYHLELSVQVAAKQTISTSNAIDGAVYTMAGDCSKNTVGQVNPPEAGVVNINYMDQQLNNIITSLKLDPSQFPVFITYGVVMSNGDANDINNCCILGYHSSLGTAADPGQTYAIAEYDQGYLFGPTVNDIFSVADEVLEWMNDPSFLNPVPAYGGTGQVPNSCQTNLEVDDALEDVLMPSITMPNGVTYHPAEVGFFSWFMGPVFNGAGGVYSTNGTLKGDAKACPPGGTN